MVFALGLKEQCHSEQMNELHSTTWLVKSDIAEVGIIRSGTFMKVQVVLDPCVNLNTSSLLQKLQIDLGCNTLFITLVRLCRGGTILLDSRGTVILLNLIRFQNKNLS
ncbi:hypothetical protein Leryth_000280 [Lithospermum erythrorhizon]|nr:hypothetical protein Leryth_000280 [Lithospermum erythrorhizon]